MRIAGLFNGMDAQPHITVAGHPTLLEDLVEQRRSVIARWLEHHPEQVELQDLGSVLHAVGVPVVGRQGHEAITSYEDGVATR